MTGLAKRTFIAPLGPSGIHHTVSEEDESYDSYEYATPSYRSSVADAVDAARPLARRSSGYASTDDFPTVQRNYSASEVAHGIKRDDLNNGNAEYHDKYSHSLHLGESGSFTRPSAVSEHQHSSMKASSHSTAAARPTLLRERYTCTNSNDGSTRLAIGSSQSLLQRFEQDSANAAEWDSRINKDQQQLKSYGLVRTEKLSTKQIEDEADFSKRKDYNYHCTTPRLRPTNLSLASTAQGQHESRGQHMNEAAVLEGDRKMQRTLLRKNNSAYEHCNTFNHCDAAKASATMSRNAPPKLHAERPPSMACSAMSSVSEYFTTTRGTHQAQSQLSPSTDRHQWQAGEHTGQRTLKPKR